jgi:hypothetical protein
LYAGGALEAEALKKILSAYRKTRS